MKKFMLTTLMLVFVLAACRGVTKVSTIPATAATQSSPLPSDLRDYRYCEIIPVFRNGLTFHVEVYNTLGSNACPADLWAKLDSEALKQQYGAVAVKLNGPRYWVLNSIVGGGATATGKVVDFGGIEMTQRAVLETKIWQGTVGDKFYTPNHVQRTTTFLYRKGNMVYELTSPEGDVYRMQSYAQIADPSLTIDDLETLGDRLDLPDGWAYQAHVLTEDSELVANGLAYVINDNLYNSYQRVSPASATK
ncbi:MAG: hypothetical protein U0175_10400 [Caldilineaceae bacterium]